MIIFSPCKSKLVQTSRVIILPQCVRCRAFIAVSPCIRALASNIISKYKYVASISILICTDGILDPVCMQCSDVWCSPFLCPRLQLDFMCLFLNKNYTMVAEILLQHNTSITYRSISSTAQD